MKELATASLGLCLAILCAEAQERILWNEAVNGPLASTPGSATWLGSLWNGTNTVFGASEIEPLPGNGNYLVHEDYLRFDITPGLRVVDILFSVDHQNVFVWVGTPDFNNTIAYNLSAGFGPLFPSGVVDTLSPGSYGMYIANHDGQPMPITANYQINFVVSAVPEPSTYALFALGAAALWFCRRPTARRTPGRDAALRRPRALPARNP